MCNHGHCFLALSSVALLPGCCVHGPGTPDLAKSSTLAKTHELPKLVMTPELHAALKRAYGFDDEQITIEL